MQRHGKDKVSKLCADCPRASRFEGAPPEDEVHLSHLEQDMAEGVNLKDTHPDVVAELTQAAMSWRETIEQRWEAEFFVPKEDITIVTYGA